jgi:hypothetical protein
VRVDASLPGAVMSPDAARVVLTKRAEAEARCAATLTDCEARATRAERGEAQALKDAATGQSWRTWGPIGIVLGLMVGAAGGLAIGLTR